MVNEWGILMGQQALLEQVQEALFGQVAESTLQAVETDLRQFLKWVGTDDLRAGLQARGGIAAYVAFMERRYRPTTVQRKRWTLNRALPLLLGEDAPAIPATVAPKAAVGGETSRCSSREGWAARLVIVVEPRAPHSLGVAAVHATVSYQAPGRGKVATGSSATRSLMPRRLDGLWQDLFGLAADVERQGAHLIEVRISADPAASQWAVGAVEALAAAVGYEFGAREVVRNGAGKQRRLF